MEHTVGALIAFRNKRKCSWMLQLEFFFGIFLSLSSVDSNQFEICFHSSFCFRKKNATKRLRNTIVYISWFMYIQLKHENWRLSTGEKSGFSRCANRFKRKMKVNLHLKIINVIINLLQWKSIWTLLFICTLWLSEKR